jgi:hypothetical protein
MKSRSIAILGLTGTLMISACSAESEPTATKVNGSSNANVVVVANGSATVANGSDPVISDIADANTTAFNGGKRVNSLTNSVKDGAQPKTGVSISAAEVLEMARKSAQPAGENSTFFSYLADAAYEVRTFNDHPLLLKVEKTVKDADHQKAKIFLRSGKVVEVDGKLLPHLSNAQVFDILSLAGIKPKSAPAGVQLEGKKPGA